MHCQAKVLAALVHAEENGLLALKEAAVVFHLDAELGVQNGRDPLRHRTLAEQIHSLHTELLIGLESQQFFNVGSQLDHLFYPTVNRKSNTVLDVILVDFHFNGAFGTPTLITVVHAGEKEKQ